MIASNTCAHATQLRQRTIAFVAALGLTAVHAQQSCPFDNGDASLTKEGLILSRYALGITGAPLVANTGIPAASAQAVEDSINSPAWGLNITGNTDVNGAPVLTTNDAVIISRKIAGFSGAALTNGLALSGPRNTPAAVQNFLLAGCPGTAWVQGGNAFGAPGVIGTTDAQPLTVRSGGASVRLVTATSHGVRIEDTSVAGVSGRINVITGLSINTVGAGIRGATIAGGGFQDLINPSNNAPNQVLGSFGTISGGLGNTASGTVSTVAGGSSNVAAGEYAVISGGTSNDTSGQYATVSGGFLNTAGAERASVGGGQQNEALGSASSISGGSSNVASGHVSSITGGQTNLASGQLASITGGSNNTASGTNSTVLGGAGNMASGSYAAVGAGRDNVAGGSYSVAMGRRAQSLGDGSFHFADSNPFDFGNNTVNAFRVRATGGVRFVTDIDGTGAITWSCAAFAGASWSCSSDRNLKHSLKKLDGRKVLAKLAAMPVYQWQPKGQNTHVKHVGPMAQDFMKAFGVGDDDKMIGMQDADGVALAAIQGLNQIVKAKDAKIAALEKANVAMQREMAAIKKRLGM